MKIRDVTARLAAITFDIDWAPDWCIELCTKMVIESNKKATFFATHQSEKLSEIKFDNQHFEIGIHPNFLPNSTHGQSIRHVLDHCLEIAPNSSSMRTHALYQSSMLFNEIDRNYQNITTDVSLFLPLHKGLAPVLWYGNRSPENRIVRLPYYWEDDVMAVSEEWIWDAPISAHEGLEIYDFHPIHVALNTDSLSQYYALKEAHPDRSLHKITKNEMEPFVNHGSGVRTFLEKPLEQKQHEFQWTVSEISQLVTESGPDINTGAL